MPEHPAGRVRGVAGRSRGRFRRDGKAERSRRSPGTRGNEGRLDYTNNFMEYVADLLIKPDDKTPVSNLLRNALFGSGTEGLQPSSVGQPVRSGARRWI